VRNRPDRYTETLRQRLEERGISSRVENALQDLLAEPLTIALLHFLKVAARSREPKSWEEATSLLLQAKGIDNQDHREAQKAADQLSSFRRTFTAFLGASSNEESTHEALEQILDFIGPSAFKQLFPQYQQGSLYEDTLQACARELASARKRTATWALAIEDFEGIDAVPIMTVHNLTT
jgi:hypothetical protein